MMAWMVKGFKLRSFLAMPKGYEIDLNKLCASPQPPHGIGKADHSFDNSAFHCISGEKTKQIAHMYMEDMKMMCNQGRKMSKTLIQSAAILLAICMFSQIALSATPASKKASQTSAYEFIADVWLDHGSYYNGVPETNGVHAIIEYYQACESFTGINVKGVKEDGMTMAAIATWEALTFTKNIDENVTDALTPWTRHEVILLEMLREIIKSDYFSNTMDQTVKKYGPDIKKYMQYYCYTFDIDLNEISGTAFIVGTDLVKEMLGNIVGYAKKGFTIAEIVQMIEENKETWSLILKSDAVNLANLIPEMLDDVKELDSTFSVIEEVTKYLGVIGDGFDQFYILEEMVDKGLQYKDLRNLTDNYLVWLDILYNETADTDLRNAIHLVRQSILNDTALEANLVYEVFAKEAGVLTKVFWDVLIGGVKEAIPALKILSLAYNWTIDLCNFGFGTNKKLEQLYISFAFVDIYEAVQKACVTCEKRYLRNESGTNAALYVASVDALFIAQKMDIEYADKYLETLKSGALQIKPDFEWLEEMRNNLKDCSEWRENRYKSLYKLAFAFMSMAEDEPEDVSEEVDDALDEIGTPITIPSYEDPIAYNTIASGQCGDRLFWVLYKDGLLEISGTGEMWDFTNNSMPWYSYQSQLKTLKLNDEITTIGDEAFNGCSGFTGSLTIPDNVVTIGNGAFAFCNGFTGNLTIGNSVKVIGEYSFNGCTGFKGRLTLGNSLETIESGAFAKSGKFSGNLIIPESVTMIGSYAFFGCCGGTVYFYGDVPCNVGYGVFDANGKDFEIHYLYGKKGWTTPEWNGYPCYPILPGDVNADNSVDATDRMILARYLAGWEGYKDKIKSIDAADIDCNGVVEAKDRVILARKLAGWEGYDQYFYPRYLNDSLPWQDPTESVQLAVGSCGENLEWKIYSDGVLEITGTGKMKDYSIDGSDGEKQPWSDWCESVTTLKLSSSLTYIGKNAFRDFTFYLSANALVIPESVETIGAYAFSSVYYDCDLVIPDSVTTIDEYAFQCSDFNGGKLILGNGLKEVKKYAFNTTNFSGDLTIPDSVMHLGQESFSNGQWTGTLTLGKSLEEIGGAAFAWNAGLTGTLTIPTGVTYIDWYAFAGCGFTGIPEFPSGLKGIGGYAFLDCTGFEGTLMIPAEVKSIEEQAFHGCVGITGARILGNAPVEMGANVFDGCAEGFTVTYAAGS